MKALISGATGFIGSHVAERLHERGYELRCLARSSSNMRWLEHLPVEKAPGSLSDVDSLKEAVRGVDIIFHIAGLTAARSREEFFKGNLEGTQNLLNAVLSEGVSLKRFLHVSSLAVCGPAPERDKPRTESDACTPITTYGESKKAAEEAVLALKDTLPVTIVRPPAVYGPRDTAVLSFFQMANKGILPLIGFDEKYVSLVHSNDLSRGIVDAAESPNTIGKTYFISSDEQYTWPQIGKVTAQVLGRKRVLPLRLPHALVMTIAGIHGTLGKLGNKPPVLDFEKGRDIIQRYWTCSTAKARRDFGYTQQTGLEAGIRSTIEFYRTHKWL